jgi:hypothetical protein
MPPSQGIKGSSGLLNISIETGLLGLQLEASLTDKLLAIGAKAAILSDRSHASLKTIAPPLDMPVA